ncbi:methyltransferase domain-containing protein [Mucilaginibacter paludis]|uniref:Methyltransferase type 11 n=1 Tax=Mucilaginibacter paludis DSM 18603 TaxID=714943 RepID=H1Y8Q1_9SPHI|nr:methyltransferase domain-containing protein [Mucilaginibacter paludis]EHQ26923.1 Methyltransferase type 11 [Mucilaginibacter paludis DSM 18603]
MIPNLRKRASEAEIMDDFSLPAHEVVPVLKGLEKMNALFGGHNTLIKALKKIPLKGGDHLSDWGCGGGDALRAIAQWANKTGLQVQLTGVDATPSAVAFARERASAYPNINFILSDVMAPALLTNQFDIVFSSLFSHHFKDDEWVALVKKMLACSKKAVIITDLHRHWVLYYAVWAIAHIFTKSKMARFDGPLSVRRSFKKTELVKLLSRAGLTNYEISWKWAFRWQLIVYKS